MFVGESITAEAEIVEVNGRRVGLRLSSYSTDSKKVIFSSHVKIPFNYETEQSTFILVKLTKETK